MSCTLFVSNTGLKTAVEEAYSRPRLTNKDLTVQALENCIVLPGKKNGLGGVLDECGIPFPQSSIHRGREGVYSYDSLIESEEQVVYVGIWGANWGHCLTDNIKLLWFIFDPQYDFLKGLKWVWSPIWGDIPDTFFDLLRKWGIESSQLIRLERPTRFKRVYLPDDCFTCDGGYKYTPEFSHFYDSEVLTTPNLKDHPVYEKVYYSRSRWALKKDDGEKYLEEAFRKMGYKVLYPESMTLDEQIFTLRHCEWFATTDGSVGHNAVFLKDGVHMVVIMKGGYTTGYQETLCAMKKLQVTVVDSNLSTCANYVAPSCGPFFLFCSQNLKEFSGGLDVGPFPLKDYLRYLFTKGPHQIRVILRYWYHYLRGTPDRKC